MKPLQIGLLVLVGALGGALIMKFTQHTKPAPAPIVESAPAPAAPVPQTAALPPVPATEPKPSPMAEATPAAPEPPVHVKHPAKAAPSHPPVTVAQSLPPAAPPVAPRPPAPEPVQETPVPAAPQELTPAPAAAPEPADPPLPAEPAPSVILKAGIVLPVRLGESLSSDHNQAGDTFTATLDAPLAVDGFVIAERGAHLEGRVVEAQKSSHVKGQALLALELTKLDTSDGQHVAIQTETIRKQAASRATGDDVGLVAAAAGIGAVIGAIAGGGKGAAIGAGAGGAAGVGGVAATRAKAVALQTEAKITFRLKEPVTLTERMNR